MQVLCLHHWQINKSRQTLWLYLNEHGSDKRLMSLSALRNHGRKHLTCPHRRLPMPKKRHHSHCSGVRLTQLNGLPPNWTMTIYRSKARSFLNHFASQTWPGCEDRLIPHRLPVWGGFQRQWSRRWGCWRRPQRRSSRRGSCEHWARWRSASGQTCWRRWCSARKAGRGAVRLCRCQYQTSSHLWEGKHVNMVYCHRPSFPCISAFLYILNGNMIFENPYLHLNGQLRWRIMWICGSKLKHTVCSKQKPWCVDKPTKSRVKIVASW